MTARVQAGHPHRLSGAAQVYGILGHPVTHSLSPAMHNAAFEALALDAVYVPLPVFPENLKTAVSGLMAAGVCGFNLTVPHKTAIMPLLTEMMPEARTVGAVNTVRRQGSNLIGTNTDGIGFLRSLHHDLDFPPTGASVLLLGAGGAARGIAFALLGAGIGRLALANRTLVRAEALAADCRTMFPDSRIETLQMPSPGEDAGPLEGLRPDLLVQTTTVGMGEPDNASSPLPLAPLGVQGAVMEIIYHPLETALMSEARTLGLPTTNGIGMLLHQGAEAFRFWTDREPPLDVMRNALTEAMQAQHV